MWGYVALLAVLAAAAVYIFKLGSSHAALKKDNAAKDAAINAKDRIVNAYINISKERKKDRTAERITVADSATELGKLYAETLSSLPNPD